MLWLVKIWQLSSCGKLMQHQETCLPIGEADRVLCRLLVMFWTVFFPLDVQTRNTAAIKSILLFKAGLFTRFLVEKCAARQSNRESDFRWHRFVFHLAWCVRGLKSLKRFWPYLMAFRSCISTGKPEYLLYLMVICSFSRFHKVEHSLCG